MKLICFVKEMPNSSTPSDVNDQIFCLCDSGDRPMTELTFNVKL